MITPLQSTNLYTNNNKNRLKCRLEPKEIPFSDWLDANRNNQSQSINKNNGFRTFSNILRIFEECEGFQTFEWKLILLKNLRNIEK